MRDGFRPSRGLIWIVNKERSAVEMAHGGSPLPQVRTPNWRLDHAPVLSKCNPQSSARIVTARLQAGAEFSRTNEDQAVRTMISCNCLS
jgi:hypothetical protein